jgi:hypothetical protein
MSTTRLKRLITPMIGAVLIAMLGGGQVAGASPSRGTIASFEGRTINLADGWDGAAVCAVTPSGTQCFATQAAFQSWAADTNPVSDVSPAPDVNCSTALELFTGTSYGGTELALYEEGIWLNLSTYGFSDSTNSYKVGACSVSMNSGTNGGGSTYPGASTAGSDATSMASGWSDRLQSVYIL